MWLAGLLLAVGSGRRSTLTDPLTARASVWQCPGHEDSSPSLSVGHARDGVRAVIRCHAGCGAVDVMAALSCPVHYLSFPPPVAPEDYARAFCAGLTFPTLDRSGGGGGGQGYRLEAEHPYGTPPVAWVVRRRHPTTGAKSCSWESANPRGERVPGLFGIAMADLPLYREPEVRAAVALGDAVVVCESESSVDASWSASCPATTWAGGADTPNLDALHRVLGDHDRVLVIADADDPGRACAGRIAAALPLARVHRMPGHDHDDARDLLTRLGPARFAALVAELLTTPEETR